MVCLAVNKDSIVHMVISVGPGRGKKNAPVDEILGP